MIGECGVIGVLSHHIFQPDQPSKNLEHLYKIIYKADHVANIFERVLHSVKRVTVSVSLNQIIIIISSHSQRQQVTWIPQYLKKVTPTTISLPSIAMKTKHAFLSAALRSNAADYVLPLFIYFIFLFFYSPFVLRNYPTDSHQIFRNCVFWCSLNNPVVLKFFWRHLVSQRKTLKTAKIWSKFHGLTQIFDNNFETVKDNSNLNQTWTRGIVSLHLWKISFWTVQGQLRSICSIGWQNLYFGHFRLYSIQEQKVRTFDSRIQT